MSTLKVTNIESPSGGGISAKINDIGGGQLSNRNLIINGAMQVAQRGTSTASVSTGGYYSVDRMRHSVTNLGALRATISQATDSPSGFSFSHRVEVTTAGAENTSAGLRVQYGIEGQDLQHLDWGTADAKSLSVSFWVKASAAGNYALILYREEGTARNIGTVFEITPGEVGNWKHITHTFPGDQNTAITNDNSGRLYLYISMGEGSDLTTTDNTTWDTYTAGRWAYGQTAKLYTTVSAYLQVTGIQLEVGDLATSFEHRSYSDELQRCQRYYYRDPTSWYQPAITDGNGTIVGVSVRHPVTMRANPSASRLATESYYWNVNGTGNSSVTPNGTATSFQGNVNFGFANLTSCTNLGGSNNDQITGQFKTQIEYSAEV